MHKLIPKNIPLRCNTQKFISRNWSLKNKMQQPIYEFDRLQSNNLLHDLKKTSNSNFYIEQFITGGQNK